MSNLIFFWLGKKYGEIPLEKRKRIFFDSLSPFLFLGILIVLAALMMKNFSLVVIFVFILLAFAILTALFLPKTKKK